MLRRGAAAAFSDDSQAVGESPGRHTRSPISLDSSAGSAIASFIDDDDEALDSAAGPDGPGNTTASSRKKRRKWQQQQQQLAELTAEGIVEPTQQQSSADLAKFASANADTSAISSGDGDVSNAEAISGMSLVPGTTYSILCARYVPFLRRDILFSV